MEHRAGPLLANRSLSALIVVSFVLSAFAGLYVLSSPPPSAAQVPIGDLIVTSGTYTIENIEQPVDGNVEVTNAELIVRNGALMVISNVGTPRTVTIGSGGALTLEHGVLTSYLDQIDPWPFLDLIVEDGGTVMATEASALLFPGSISVQTGGELILYDSTIDQIDDGELSKYLSGSTSVTLDSADDGPAITVSDGSLMLFDSSIAALPEYPGDAMFAENLTLIGDSTLLAVNSYIDVDFGPADPATPTDWYVHNALELRDSSGAYLYGCEFEPYNGLLSERVTAVNAATGTDAYVYRWLSVTVGDEYGVPIPNADIDATFTGSTALEGQPLVYYTSSGTSSTPPTEVLDYMGETTGSVFVTKSDGITEIPFLTDIIASGDTSNSGYVGSFEITGTTVIDSTPHSSTEAFSFPAYPAMTSEDQSFEVTVDIEGISAESPDSSRWLVVPPSLLIEDMEYYHAGDVIVASDGTLTLLNAVFREVQSVANEFTIYVDGTANFVIEDSELTSALPVNVIVKGSGTLDIRDSTLTGVDIIAMEQAVVKLNGASVDGSITTTWDSEAHLMIYDSVLAQSPTVSGDSVCEITNTSAPSLIVTDSATALVYRWIHITVFDGGDYPLEGALVSARFYVNQTFWTSEVTDSAGVARLKSLGTIITESGATYVGQYRVNASYWSDGVEHKQDAEVNVSVKPYSEPLTENATFAYLTLSTVLLPDLSVESDEFWTAPVDLVLNTPSTLNARIWNLGEVSAYDAVVDFYVGASIETGTLIGSYTSESITAGSYDDVWVSWTPTTATLYTLWVEVNGGHDFDERSFSNNNASIVKDVLDYADLEMTDIKFYPLGSAVDDTTIAGGTTIIIRAELSNVGEAPVTNVEVGLNVTDGSSHYEDSKVVTATIRQNGMVMVEFEYTLPMVDENTEFTVEMTANPDRTINEWVWTNNNVSGTLTVLDVRPDFKVAVEDVYIQYGEDNLTAPVYGMNITIVAIVHNLGGTDPGPITVQFGLLMFQENPIANRTVSIGDGDWQKVEAYYHINITDAGNYTMYVLADSEGVVSEKSETNNYVEFGFEIEQLEVDIIVDPTSDEYEAEDEMTVNVLVRYAGTETPVVDLRGVAVEVRSESGTVITSEPGVSTNSDGKASFSVDIPKAVESGTYTVVCTVAGLAETGSATVEIHGIVSGGGIPLMVWIIVIAAIAAGAIGVTAYVYWYGLGKLVECGECGEFIPASNKRCPKCGVEFEVGTMKCSECGAWVPAESAECPNCGVKFVGEEVEEGDYLEKMRKEYDEMTSKYRELAKAELGKKFSDKKFEEWWVAQPTYISFEDWLAKEEEKRKEGPVACPVCGTLNPKEATVCNRCGTVFGAAQETEEDQGPPPYPPVAGQEQAPPAQQQEPVQPQPAPKMVIRRPIDRKVVPKKVIKTPINQNGSEGGEGNEGQ